MTAITTNKLQRSRWQTIVLLTLAFWLSSSLLLDFIIMPGLYAAGMMTEPGFATAGYAIFGIFNRFELLSAALILTSVLVLKHLPGSPIAGNAWIVPVSIGLMAVALIYTYDLTPTMSALGLPLNLFEPATVPATMSRMHQSYWLLEVFKLAGCIGLLKRAVKL